MDKYTIGNDPGFGETGLVLYKDSDTSTPLEWATFRCTNAVENICVRTVSLAGHVIDTTLAWITKYDIKLLDIGIETPVLGKGVKANPLNYAKQMRLVQEIESGIMFRVAAELKECWVTEVNPKRSKVLATNYGGANKAMMVNASPFIGSAGVPRLNMFALTPDQSTLEALADAWAHGLATWDPTAKGRYNFCGSKVATVRRVV